MGKTLALGVAGAVLAAGAVAFVLPGSEVRKAAVSLMQHQECFKGDTDTGGMVALGDSITAGHSLPAINMRGDNSYTDVLSCRDGEGVTNMGVWQETSTQILARIGHVLDRKPETVVVLAGTNDVLTGDTSKTTHNLTLLKGRLDKAGVRGVFGLLPPNDRKPAEVQALNKELLAWADNQDATLVDYWRPLADAEGRYKVGMADDATHPSAAGAEVMADQLAAALR